MINGMIEAISVALNEEFGDEYEIYRESVRQDLKEPCFFIQILNPTVKQVIKNRYFRSNQFCIQFFPESVEKRKECEDVAERMLWCLEYIHLEGEETPVRGTQMHGEIVDDILHFFVNYDCYVHKSIEADPSMEIMESKEQVKEGE